MTTPDGRVNKGDLWIIAVALLAIPVIVLCLFVLPGVIAPDRSATTLEKISSQKDRLQAEDNRTKLQNDIRSTLIQAVAGAFFLITAFFTWRQTRTSQRQLEVSQGQLELARQQLATSSGATQEQLRLTREQLDQTSASTQEQLRLARQEQTTDLFTRAIDQLGSGTDGIKNIEVRIGAIYALERIAKQSHEDLAVVAEVLAAYVRRQSPWPPPDDSLYPQNYPIQRLPSLRIRVPDVQTALTVLGRLVPPDKAPPQYDLSRTDLRRATLNNGNFQRAHFKEANLENADMLHGHFRRADFGPLYETHLELEEILKDRGAILKNANFGGSDLRDADFFEANLEGAYLAGVNLEGASFIGANLVNANLQYTDLRKANIGTEDIARARTNDMTKWPEDPSGEQGSTTEPSDSS